MIEQEGPNLDAPVMPTMGPQLHEMTIGYTQALRQADQYRRAALQMRSERDTALREVTKLKEQIEKADEAATKAKAVAVADDLVRGKIEKSAEAAAKANGKVRP